MNTNHMTWDELNQFFNLDKKTQKSIASMNPYHRGLENEVMVVKRGKMYRVNKSGVIRGGFAVTSKN